MNSRDKSLEDRPSVVTKAFPCISLIILDHFYWFYRFYGRRGLSSVGELQGSLKTTTYKGLFHNLQVVCCHMEWWIEYLDEYK